MSWLSPLTIGLTQGCVMVGAVLAFAIAFRLLGFPDLTIEGTVPLSAGTYAVLVQHDFAPLAAAIVACAAGAACGATTALLNIRFGINRFLAGIIVVSIGYSLTLRIMGGPNLSLLQQPALLPAALDPLLGRILLWCAVTLLLLLFLGSRAGTALRAAGSNPGFAKSIGISQARKVVAGIAACNALAAVSGVLQADNQGFADVSSGPGVLILALAALALGEALLPQRRLSYYKFVVFAAIFGSLAYHVIVALAVRAGLQPTDLKLATGVLVLLVVALRFPKAGSALDEIGVAR